MSEVDEIPAKNTNVKSDANLFVLIPSDEHEERRARDFWDSQYPKSKAKLVLELKVQRLTNDHTIVCLYRKPPDRPKFLRMEGGLRESLPSEEPVLVSKPIKVSDFWTEDGDDGVVDYLALVRAIGALIVPFRPVYRADELSLRVLVS
jgi:hypothetical protein